MDKLTENYKKDFKSRFTYNSNNIEGNTISLAETVSIILDNYVTSAGSLREIYEVVNHSEAIDFIFDTLNEEITVDYIKKIHKILLDKLNFDRGNFKQTDNYILGADFETTPVSQVGQVMHQYIDNLNYKIENTNEDIFELVADTHIQFERIHPFSDGNGRTGRLLINKVLLSHDIAPIVIEGNEKKRDYYNMLREQDVSRLSDYFRELSYKEEKRIISFENDEKQKIDEFEM